MPRRRSRGRPTSSAPSSAPRRLAPSSPRSTASSVASPGGFHRGAVCRASEEHQRRNVGVAYPARPHVARPAAGLGPRRRSTPASRRPRPSRRPSPSSRQAWWPSAFRSGGTSADEDRSTSAPPRPACSHLVQHAVQHYRINRAELLVQRNALNAISVMDEAVSHADHATLREVTRADPCRESAARCVEETNALAPRINDPDAVPLSGIWKAAWTRLAVQWMSKLRSSRGCR